MATLQGIADDQKDSPLSVLPAANSKKECNEKDSSGSCKRPTMARTMFAGPLLPFDTLMMPMPLSVMLQIATAASRAFTHYEYQPTTLEIIPSMTCAVEASDVESHSPVSPPLHCTRKLRLGFISFDFTDHPTAHLIEAVFHIVRTYQGCGNDGSSCNSDNSIDTESNSVNTATHSMLNVELIIFSYGKDDESQYRARLQHLSHKFVDIVNYSFQQAAEAIRAEHIDILLDLQIHTLGKNVVCFVDFYTYSFIYSFAVEFTLYRKSIGNHRFRSSTPRRKLFSIPRH